MATGFSMIIINDWGIQSTHNIFKYLFNVKILNKYIFKKYFLNVVC